MTNNGKNRTELTLYFQELGCLSSLNDLQDCSLSKISFMEEVKKKASHLDFCSTKKFLFDFKCLASSKFEKFKQSLFEANSSPIYIWTPRTNKFGLFELESIALINFSFPFDVNPEGIFVILTSDLQDKLLFDFYRDAKDVEKIEIEVTGKNWFNKVSQLQQVVK